jgi:hypothetical protein
MDSTEAKTRLMAIRDNLPMNYSQNSARKLMSSFENYRQVTQELGNKYAAVFSGVQTKLGDMETDIREAIKGTPKKEAETRFAAAKSRLTEGIGRILSNLELIKPGSPK